MKLNSVFLLLEKESESAKDKETTSSKKVTIADFIDDDGEGDDDYREEGEQEAEDEEIDLGEESEAEEDVDEDELEEVAAIEIEEQETMAGQKKSSTKKVAPSKTTKVDDLCSSMKALKVCSTFDMSFHFPYVLVEHMDHGQKIVSVELMIIGTHRSRVHLKILPGGDVLQVKVAVPPLFYSPQRTQVANDDGTGTFNVNTHKATAFQAVCQEIMKIENDDTGEVFGKPQLIKLPFECDEIFYKGHAGDKDGWDIQVYDNDDSALKREIGNSDLFTLNIDCVSKEKPLQTKSRGRMRRVTRPAPPRTDGKRDSSHVDETRMVDDD